MRLLRTLFRLARLLFVAYGMWEAFLRSRWVTVGFALWKILKRRRARNVKRAAALTFINGSEPAIFRRIGWRRVLPRRARNFR